MRWTRSSKSSCDSLFLARMHSLKVAYGTDFRHFIIKSVTRLFLCTHREIYTEIYIKLPSNHMRRNIIEEIGLKNIQVIGYECWNISEQIKYVYIKWWIFGQNTPLYEEYCCHTAFQNMISLFNFEGYYHYLGWFGVDHTKGKGL